MCADTWFYLRLCWCPCSIPDKVLVAGLKAWEAGERGLVLSSSYEGSVVPIAQNDSSLMGWSLVCAHAASSTAPDDTGQNRIDVFAVYRVKKTPVCCWLKLQRNNQKIQSFFVCKFCELYTLVFCILPFSTEDEN